MSSSPFGPFGGGGNQQQRLGMNTRGCGIRLAPILIGVIAIGFFMAKGCEKGPFGRRQLVGMEIGEEKRLGAQAFDQVIHESDVVEDPAIKNAVKRVATNLIAASRSKVFSDTVKIPTRDFEWQLSVVESPQVNAFCLPGGKIVVYTGILPVSRTEAGLAVVMGHEIAHALARHGAERMAQEKLINIGQMAAFGSIGDMDPAMQKTVMTAFGLGAKFGVQLPFSRDHESEADHLGLFLMAIAGYDPEEAPKFWVRMSEATKGGQPPEFMSTHPGHETRVHQLQEWQKEVRPFYEASQKQPDGNRLLPGE